MTAEERQRLLDKLANYKINFNDIETDLRKDRELVILAVANHWEALKYVGEEFRNDEEIVKLAVSNFGFALQFAGEALRNNREIVRIAVLKSGITLQYAGEEVKNDREIVKLAVSKSGNALQYAGEALRNDRDIVELAVSKSGAALQYAGNELRNNREIVKIAVSNDGGALEYAGEALRNDKQIVKMAIASYGKALQYAGEALRNDKEIVKVAVTNRWEALQYAGESLRNDKEIVMAAVTRDWYALQYAGEETRNDKEIVTVAVSQNWRALEYAGEKLKNDKEIIKLAALKDSRALIYVGTKLKNDDNTIIKISELAWDGFNKDRVTNEEMENIRTIIKKIDDFERLTKIELEQISILSSILKSKENLAKIEKEQLPQELQKLLKERLLRFEDLKKNPNWKHYLRGKNCETIFEYQYRYALKCLGDQAINLGTRDPERLEKMLKYEHLMAIWYEKVKFLPSPIIMKNIPTGSIDKFLHNKEKWARLAGNIKYQDDDSKLSLLKASYALGVFENKKEGYEIIDKIINSLPLQLEIQEYQKLENIKGIEFVYQKKNEERYVFKREEHLEVFNYLLLMETLAENGITASVLTKQQYVELLGNQSFNRWENKLLPAEIREMMAREGDNFVVKAKPNGYELSRKLLYQIGVKPDQPLTTDQYQQIDKLGADYLKRIFTKQEDGTYKFNMRVESTGNGEVFLHEGQGLKSKNLEEISKANKKLFDYTRVLFRECGLITEANMLGANERQNINIIIDEAQYNKVLKEAEIIKDNTKKGYQLEIARYEKIATVDPNIENEIIKAIIEQDIRVKGVMTPEKLHRVFDKLKINYNEEFGKFFRKYIDKIIEDPILYDRIGNIQERYSEIKRMNPEKEITLTVALAHITNQTYPTLPGFEKGAEYAKDYGYSLEKYRRAEAIWDEARRREASSIPRVVEELENGWSYEVLRLDDPLGVFVGELTNCCQALDAAGQSSMEHSMKKSNGRVLVIRDNNGEITGQGWLWEEKKNGKRVICIDNVEIPASKRSGEHSVKIKETLENFVVKLVKTDDERMTRLMAEGKITKKQYESNQLTTVTIGLVNSDIDFSDKQRVKAEELILPKENVYTDAKHQAILYERKVKAIHDNRSAGLIALHRDELNEKTGKQISPTDIKTIKNIEREAYNDNPEMIMMGEIKTVEELGKLYSYKPEEMRLIKGVDWYMVYAETAETVHILDIAKTPKSGIIRKSAQERETAYERILEKAAAGKTLLTEARERTAYKTVQRMIVRNQNRYDIRVMKDQTRNDFRNEASHHLMLSVSERKGRGEPTNSSKWAFGG